jgi:CHASE1-domain containing sensor protein
MTTNDNRLSETLANTIFSAPSYRWLLQILGLAIAYFMAGKLSYFSTIPPGYDSAIWPPAGVALAGVLIYGYRVWPGILLGAFLLNGLIPELTGLNLDMLTSVLVTLVISIGSSLQAIVGAYLVKRYAGFPNALKYEKDVVLFFFYGGLLATLINSTLSVSILVATGKTSAENFLANWVTWWTGDVLGVVIFTPLALVWLLQDNEAWHNRRLVITLPILFMFTLTATAVFYEAQTSNERIKLDFDRQAATLNDEFNAGFNRHINAFISIKSYYASSDIVSREKFKIFTKLLLDNFQGIQALSWDPLIRNSEREVFEKNIQKAGHPNFQLTERDAEQKFVRAGSRYEYVSALFLEPYKGNESALGYDVYSNQLRREAIDRARYTGELALTAGINLVQEQSKQQGVIAFIPIYRNDRPQQTLEEKRNAISGYAVAVFKTSDIITEALKNQKTSGLFYRLIDTTAPASEQLLFSSDEQLMRPLVIQEKAWFSAKKTLSSNLIMYIGGRIWQFEVVPKQDYFSYHRSGNTWLVLLAGLVLTSLVTMVVLVVSGWERMLPQLP